MQLCGNAKDKLYLECCFVGSRGSLFCFWAIDWMHSGWHFYMLDVFVESSVIFYGLSFNELLRFLGLRMD